MTRRLHIICFLWISLCFVSCDLYENNIDLESQPLWYFSKRLDSNGKPLDSVRVFLRDRERTLNLYKDRKTFYFSDGKDVEIRIFELNGDVLAMFSDPDPYFYKLGPEGFRLFSHPGNGSSFFTPVKLLLRDLNHDGFDDILVFEPDGPGAAVGRAFVIVYEPEKEFYFLCEDGEIPDFVFGDTINVLRSSSADIRSSSVTKATYEVKNNRVLFDETVSVFDLSDSTARFVRTKGYDTVLNKEQELKTAWEAFNKALWQGR